MKKSILAVAVLIGATSFAQDDADYLPVSGDWAIGIDATPFLNYAGNLIGGNDGNVAPTWNYLTTNQTITGKMFVADDMAYRASIRLGFGSTKGSEMVSDRAQDPASIVYPSAAPNMVENTWKTGYMSVGLGGGLEYRRGHGRLQGFYGGELGINISSSSQTFTYGNALTQTTSGPNVDVDPDDEMGFGNQAGVTDPFGNGARVTEWKSGTMFGVGLRGFIGAEYFIFPQIAVGGEFGWGLVFMTNGTSSTTVESEGFDAGFNEVTSSFTTESNNGSSFGIDTDNVNTVFGPAATLRMTFHF